MHKFTLITLLWIAGASLPPGLLAQSIPVTGQITSEDNNTSLPGVNVLVKNSTVGTVADIDGAYRIEVPTRDATLIFSFVGYLSKEVKLNGQTELNVKLSPDTKMLEDVVVTSFGIEKETKKLGFSVQEVGGEELAQTSRPNVISSLQGRVAGVNVSSSTGLPGSSANIVIRGGTSLDGNNQPLFVVDGVPIDNTTLNGSYLLADTPNRNFDYTSRGMDINPDDIESVTVLKGPSAAALYGIDAANGAIVITTKKGKAGKAMITYNNDFRLEEITRFPDLYNKYSQGLGGVNSDVSLSHWGQPLPADTPMYNNVDNLFGRGFTQSHDISVSGGNDNMTYRASGSLLRQNGSVPNTGYNRNSIRLNLSAKPLNKLSVTGSFNYIRSTADRTSKGNGSLYQNALLWPAVNDVRKWQYAEDNAPAFLADPDNNLDNPYFTLNKNQISDETDRFLMNGSATYQFTDWLSVTGRIGADLYNTYGLTAYDPESYQAYPNRARARNVGGLMAEYDAKSSLINSFIFLNADKSFGDFNVSLTLGNNTENRNYRVDSRYGEGIQVPGLYTIINTNRATREVGVGGYRRSLASVFGELSVGYKNLAFLTVTGRNDWSSTLPKQNNSFFYPSISGSFVFSEAFNLDVNSIISFGKIRASVAQVGKDAPPHKTRPALDEFTGTGGGFQVNVYGANENIVPETTTSYEAGFDLRFLANRLSLDFTYYNVRSKNQIVSPRLSYVSGYILQLINAGEIENRGVELMLNGALVKKQNFQWDLIANFSLNRNKVLSLPGGFDEFYLSDTWLYGNARGGYIRGESFYTITGYSWLRNDDNQLVINTSDNPGYPALNTTFHVIGNRQPDFTLGLTNNFTYKGFNLSFLWDIRKGGDIFNGTARSLTYYGLTEQTANRGETTVFQGVTEDGAVNTQEVALDQDYYRSATGRIEANFIEKDINWFRLRDISLSYNLPIRLLENTFVEAFQVHASANNLILITNYSGPDPDINGLNASARGSNAAGFDYFAIPNPVVYSAGLKLTL